MTEDMFNTPQRPVVVEMVFSSTTYIDGVNCLIFLNDNTGSFRVAVPTGMLGSNCSYDMYPCTISGKKTGGRLFNTADHANFLRTYMYTFRRNTVENQYATIACSAFTKHLTKIGALEAHGT